MPTLRSSTRSKSPAPPKRAQSDAEAMSVATRFQPNTCSTAVSDSPKIDDFICPCCRELLYRAVTIACGHTCCESCLAQWFQTNDDFTEQIHGFRCPAGCQTRIPRVLPEPNVILQELLTRHFGRQLMERDDSNARARAAQLRAELLGEERTARSNQIIHISVRHSDLPADFRLQLRVAAGQMMDQRGEAAANANPDSSLAPWLDAFQAQTLFRSLPPVGSPGWLSTWTVWVLRCIATVIPMGIFAFTIVWLMPIIFTTFVVEFLTCEALAILRRMLRALLRGDFATIRRQLVPSTASLWRFFIVNLVGYLIVFHTHLSCCFLTLSGLTILQLPHSTPQHMSINGECAKVITLVSALGALLPLMLLGSAQDVSAIETV